MFETPGATIISTIGVRASMTPRRIVAGLLFLMGCGPQVAPPPTPTPAPPSGPPPQSAPRVEPAPPAIIDGPSLLTAMHDRYPSWYRTMAFVQTTTIYRTNGELVQKWYEMAALPGRLRIDTDVASRAGQLFANDSIYTVANGKVTRADAGLNQLLVLGFDVYRQPPARTAAQLRRLGFDLTKLHRDTWNGKLVFVVGAAAGDTTSKQFWIDRDDLLFVRAIAATPRGRTDVRFDRYQRVKGGWIATEVLQLVNGRPTLREQYANVQIDPVLDDVYFDPRVWPVVERLFLKP
jgi:hypothetical protein